MRQAVPDVCITLLIYRPSSLYSTVSRTAVSPFCCLSPFCFVSPLLYHRLLCPLLLCIILLQCHVLLYRPSAGIILLLCDVTAVSPFCSVLRVSRIAVSRFCCVSTLLLYHVLLYHPVSRTAVRLCCCISCTCLYTSSSRSLMFWCATSCCVLCTLCALLLCLLCFLFMYPYSGPGHGGSIPQHFQQVFPSRR